MAERRMFAKTIIDSDAFLDMPISTRLLYYDLAMRADDDGFINSPKKIMKIVGATQDDLNVLILRKFIIPFDSGVVVIKHWRIHNYIRKDTYNETPYKEEKALLELDENKSYRLPCNNVVDESSTQVRLGKVSIGKDIIEEEQPKKEKRQYADFVKMTEEEYKKLISRFGEKFTMACINVLDNYKGAKGVKYKDDYRAILSWVTKRVEEDGLKPQPPKTEEYEEFNTDSLSNEEYAKLIKGEKNV